MNTWYLPGEGSTKNVYTRINTRNEKIQNRIWKMRVDKMLYWFENEKDVEQTIANLKISVE